MVNVPVIFLSERVNFLGVLLCRGEKTWWELAYSCCCLICFLSASVTRKTYNSAHEQPTFSNDTIDSVLRHQEVGRPKDLRANPRIFNFYVGTPMPLYSTCSWLYYIVQDLHIIFPFFLARCSFLTASWEAQCGQCGTDPGSTARCLHFPQHSTTAQHSYIINI